MADNLEEVKVRFAPVFTPVPTPTSYNAQGLVTRTLDAQGVLAKLKAEIRSHVFTGEALPYAPAGAHASS